MKKLLVLGLAFVLCACGGAATTTKGEGEYVFTDHDGAEQKVTAVVELEDGKVTKVEIDETYTKDGEQTTKKTLGDDYGMSAIGKVEWDDQVAHLEEQLVGTDGTIELDEAGYATNEDVLSTCTINLTNIEKAVANAIANAK